MQDCIADSHKVTKLWEGDENDSYVVCLIRTWKSSIGKNLAL